MVAEDTLAARTGSPAAPAVPVSGFRPDVEGLRAIAVGLVLLYHGGLSFLPGGFVGVDVFFVISGFLITSLLIKEVDRGGTISLPRFYARRAKRLLPAAAIVLAATAALTFLVLPRTRWSDIGGDIASAALYFVNWRLAATEVDYLAENSAASPVQHFWSLAVEEQYYFVWPVLLLIAAFVARRLGRAIRPTLWAGLAAIALPSFAWSIHYTATEPTVSFFVTTTRVWELAIGAAVAIGITKLAALPRAFAIVLGWAGVAAILASAYYYTTSTAWPGYAALLPTTGTAAVIAAGASAGPRGPIALLGTRCFTWIGGLSYSLYLWHWPLIVIATAYWDGLTPAQGLAVALFSVVPAWLTLRFIENPIRFSPKFAVNPWPALRLGAVLTVSGLAAGLGVIVATSLATQAPVGHAPGAAALSATPGSYQPDKNANGSTPDPLNATADVPDSYGKGCQVDQVSPEPVVCAYGDPAGKIDVALVGDSKALQWISAIDDIGKERGWRVRTYTKSSCPFTAATIVQNGKPYDNCRQWGDNVEAKLLDDPPDVVITSQIRAVALEDSTNAGSAQTQEVMVDGLRERWSTLTDAGIKLIVMRDNPNPPQSLQPVYECVDQHRDDVAPCAFSRAEGEELSGERAQFTAAKDVPGVEVVDLNDYICPGDVCPPVIGDVLVYRQGAHLTETYIESLEPMLEERLAAVIGT